MKKLILSLIVLIALVGTTNAQDKTLQIKTGNSITGRVTFDDADTIAAGKTSYILLVEAPQQHPCTQDLMISLDSISTPTASLQLAGSKFGSTYTSIGSAVPYSGSTADTTFIISNATENRYRYYRLTVTRSAGKAAITDFKFKLYYE
jgi:hypothetical protein